MNAASSDGSGEQHKRFMALATGGFERSSYIEN